ncbi:XkdX family protein [Liquorilactobacillus mali]|nr:XkdX family protein [Liquorilactobacillus mali]
MLDFIKEYYILGLYTDNDLQTFFNAGMLTSDEETTIKESKATSTS